MTVDPDSIAERQRTVESKEDEENPDAKGPLDAETHPSRRETTLRDDDAEGGLYGGPTSVDGNPKEKLRRIQEAKDD